MQVLEESSDYITSTPPVYVPCLFYYIGIVHNNLTGIYVLLELITYVKYNHSYSHSHRMQIIFRRQR